MLKDLIFLPFLQASFESQQEIQLLRFANYFGRAFFKVSASQFLWTKMFKDSPVAKIIDVSRVFTPSGVIFPLKLMNMKL